MKSAFYRQLVALHPPEFRRRFGQQMESIFDESGRPPSLLLDVAVSSFRQWMLRSIRVWLIVLATVGGLIPFELGLGVLNFTRWYFGVSSPHRTSFGSAVASNLAQPVTKSFVMLTAAIAVMFISGTMLFAITWFRISRRRKPV